MIKNILLAIGILAGLFLVITGVRVLLLLRSVTSYKNYWSTLAGKEAPESSIIYIALGDSAAQGVGASSASSGYVGLVAKHLAGVTGKPVKVINISVSGAKLRDIIDKQVPQLRSLPKADYISIEAGANDMATFDPIVFKSDFKKLVEKLPAGTYVANMPSFKGGRKGVLDKNAQNASQIISEQVAARPDLHIVNLYKATMQQNLLNFAADLFHPNDSGYQNWANAFIEAIDSSK